MPFTISLTSSLAKLSTFGVYPKSAVDIGAHHGEWYKAFKQVFPCTSVLSVEANPLAFEILKQENPNSLNSCFSDRQEKRLFYLPNEKFASSDTGASLYKENRHFYDAPSIIQIETQTLDDLSSHFDYIKLDVQGAELDVLRGGMQTLSSADFVQIEVSVLQYNQASPLSAELISFLHLNHFSLLDITEILVYNDRICQLDLLFCATSKYATLMSI